MRLYLLRHGIALNRLDPSCPPDFERPLTEKGIARTGRATRGLAALGVAPDLVLSSPYLRAKQTAAIAARALGIDESAIRESSSLVPEADPDDILEELACTNVASALCVGHAPNLDLVIGRALGLRYAALTGLKKAGAACVETYSSNSGCMIWLMEPKGLRAIA